MKKTSTSAQLGAGLLVGLLATSGAGAVVINFDTTPDGHPIANSTDVTLTYASLGVSFALDGSGCGTSVYANADRPPSFGSAPNVVSTCSGSTASDINGQAHGRIRVDLNAPATRVCIDVLPDGEQYNAELSVYDADDKLVAKKASAPGVAGTLCVDGAGIRHARFPGTGDTSTEYARFDNLDVTFAQVTPNYGGLWWNAPVGSEAGWGINFAHQGDIIFATWFTYDANGKPWWLAVQATRTQSGVYQGDLFTTTGPAFNADPFDPGMVTETTVGTATFTFADNNHATFAYTVNGIAQTKSISRQVFATPVPFCVWNGGTALALATNYQDLWWNANESGWGINFTHQGDIVFATWFTYDAAGKPWWLIAELHKGNGGVFTGPVSTVTGPPFNASPFDPSKVVETQVGTATLTFANGNSASFAYTVNGTTQTKAIARQVWAPSGTVCK